MGTDDSVSSGGALHSLTPAQHEQLVNALTAAFNPFGFQQLAQFGLGTSLNDIVPPGTERQVAFELVDWAIREGRLDDLVARAIEQNPRNPQLQQFHREVWASPQLPPNGPKPSEMASRFDATGAGSVPTEPAQRDLRTQMAQGSTGKKLDGFLKTSSQKLVGTTLVVATIAVLLIVALIYSGTITGPRNSTPTPSPTSPPPVMRGILSDLRVEPNVTLGDGCRNRGWPCETFSLEQYATPGQLVSVTAQLLGYTGREAEVRWSLYAEQTEKAHPRFQNQPGWPGGRMVPEGPDDQGLAQVWIPLPNQPGRFFARLTLVNDRGAELYHLDTEPFDGKSTDST